MRSLLVSLCVFAALLLWACDGGSSVTDGDTDLLPDQEETDSTDDTPKLDAELPDGDDLEEPEVEQEELSDAAEEPGETDEALPEADVSEEAGADTEPDDETEAEEEPRIGDRYEDDDTIDQATLRDDADLAGMEERHDFTDDAVDIIPFSCVAGRSVFIYVVAYLNETNEYILDEQGVPFSDLTRVGSQDWHRMTERILWNCDATARRFIKIENGYGRVNDVDGYLIRVFSPVPADPYEQDDSRAAAADLGEIPDQDEALVQEDRTFFDDLWDWAAFDGLADTVYTVTVTGIDDNVRPALALYLEGQDDPAAEELNIGATEHQVVITLPLAVAGRVSLGVTNANGYGGINTAYRLEIYKERSTPQDYYESADIDSFSNNDELSTAETVPSGATCHFRFTHRTGLIQDDWDCVVLPVTPGQTCRVSAAAAACDLTQAATKFRLYDEVSDTHYQGFARGSSNPAGETDGPREFTAAVGTSYFACFYSDIEVPMDQWATYTFTVEILP